MNTSPPTRTPARHHHADASPAFLAEVTEQIAIARDELAAARAAGDDDAAVTASNRILDLDDLAERATDPTLLIEDS